MRDKWHFCICALSILSWSDQIISWSKVFFKVVTIKRINLGSFLKLKRKIIATQHYQT
jgi:hypothetical protein